MVSFWPFGGDDNSAASFEKALSQLSTRINKTSAANDKFRLRQRKYKVLWTLYAVFTYILIDAILVLVTGWEKWSYVEYTVVAGGPPFIYAIRTALDSYYSYRVSGTQATLNDLHKQREAVIARLKSATKYDSTQQLLEKYGGSPKRKAAANEQQPPQNPSTGSMRGSRKGGNAQLDIQNWSRNERTGLPPPPTANIAPKPRLPLSETTPSNSRPGSAGAQSVISQPAAEIGEEFAPNAFTPPRRPAMVTQPSHYATAAPKWYDRILDVMLGEDEGSAKNRIVLLCENCRLVNGQAPPGARTLEDIGKWRCGSCHAWNGVESEASKMLKQMSQEVTTEGRSRMDGHASQKEGPGRVEQDTSDGETRLTVEHEELDTHADSDVSIAGSTRSKLRQRRKS